MDLNSILLIILIVMLGATAYYLRMSQRRRFRQVLTRTRRIRNEIANVSASSSELLLLWHQIESLLALYRFMDGRDELPSTRRWVMSPDMLLHLVNYLRLHPVQAIIECGGGASTIVMAYALKQLGRDAHIWTLENHPKIAMDLKADLERRGLCRFVTILVAPLVAKQYPEFDVPFQWYSVDKNQLPRQADLLVVDGPYGKVNPLARYPAGPELLPLLAPHAHIFIDDADRPDESQLPKLWRARYPDLGVRELRAEKGAIEMFFLDHKVKEYRPQMGLAAE